LQLRRLRDLLGVGACAHRSDLGKVSWQSIDVWTRRIAASCASAHRGLVRSAV